MVVFGDTKWYVIFVILVGISCASCDTQDGKVVCYYSSWSAWRPEGGKYTIDDIPGEKCTHVVYAFVDFEKSSYRVSEGEVKENDLTKFSTLREKFPHLKLILAIGGWGQGGRKLKQMVALQERRKIFIESIIALLVEYKSDGLDFMWQWPGSPDRSGSIADKDNYVTFVEEIKSAFKKDGRNYEISISAPVDRKRLKLGYNIYELCKNVDSINLMTYDLRGFWDNFIDVHSPLNGREERLMSVTNGADFWIDNGCPPQKIVIGAPFFGRSFTLESESSTKPGDPNKGAGKRGSLTNDVGFLAYHEICGRNQDGWTQKWDEIGACPYSYNGTQWVGYEDKKSLTIKAKMIRDRNLAGMMVFSLDTDDFEGTCGDENPLLSTVWNELKEYKIVIPEKRGTFGKIVCYYSNWGIFRSQAGKYSIDDIPGDKCTHIIYAFSSISEIQSTDDNRSNGLMKFMELRHKYPNLKLIVSFGGWAQGGAMFTEMVSSLDKRSQFIANLIRTLKFYNLDGADLMWQWPGESTRNGLASDKDNFVLLLKEMRQSLDAQKRDWELSIAVPIEETKLNTGYRIADICRYVDAVHTMSYDLRGFWSGKADVHSSLYKRPNEEGYFANFNVNDGVELWVTGGCAKEKMVVGVPFFGRSFTLSNSSSSEIGSEINGAGEAGEYTNDAGFLSYYEICQRLDNGWTAKFDDVGLVPYAFKSNQWVGYENIESLKTKMKWIREKGFAGAMVFALDLDDFKGFCGSKYPLLNVVSDNMEKYRDNL